VYLGYRVEASGGVEGIAKAIELQPDLIIMDLAMPGLDGFDATRVLKAVSLTKGIPVVALTAHGDHLPREWATMAGCDVYLRKPILPGDLAAEIEHPASDRTEGPRLARRRRVTDGDGSAST
jgi:CheY-like chemotaxis protein